MKVPRSRHRTATEYRNDAMDDNDLFSGMPLSQKVEAEPTPAPVAQPAPRAAPAAPASTGGDDYGASSIRVLEGLEPVRMRPGMYIGGTDEKALHTSLPKSSTTRWTRRWPVTPISSTCIWMPRLPDCHRQWPRYSRRTAPQVPGKSTLEVIMTKLHAGGKFDGKALRDFRRSARCRRLRRQRTVRPLGSRGSRAIASSIVRPSPAAFRRAGSKSWAKCITAAARAFVFTRIRRSRGSCEIRSRPIFRMARSKAYLFGGVEIRWSCDPGMVPEGGDIPEKAVFHFPGGLKDYLAATLARTSRSRAKSSPARPRRPVAMAHWNGRSPGMAAIRRCIPIVTRSRRLKAARMRLASHCADQGPQELRRADAEQAGPADHHG